MLKRLPILIIFFVAFFFGITQQSFAQPAPGAPQIGVQPTTTPVPAGEWVPSADVTFVGKTASRSGDFLDWTLRNYDWACVVRTGTGICDNTNNPLTGFWALVRNIVYALLLVFILAAAFILIVTRGRNVTIVRFIPRFILIIILITLSYSLVQFLYQLSDIVTGFFLRVNGKYISTQDLIYIGFDYKNFVGYRLAGVVNDESAFITLLLVRLTAITYYVMTGILIVRKIILWFFIILSPVFPILLFFSPIRNTAKIWIGEFFRWLLYAPLFALFLHGLVVLWKSQTGIPLPFDFVAAKNGETIYPTAVNILIGGPGQKIGIANSVNLPDTFALYIVALLMLWVVILLPFILLKIFLDYIGSVSWQDNTHIKRFMDRLPFVNRAPPSPITPTPPITPPPVSAGMARELPFASTKNISEVNTTNIKNITAVPQNAQILHLANLSVPKMRDIARFETSQLSNNLEHRTEANKLRESLRHISNPTLASNSMERDKFHQVRQQLLQEKQKGNVLASNILNAASSTTRQGAASAQRNVLSALQQSSLPAVNRVQEVSLEDYEEVRKMWLESYQTADVPHGLDGTQESRMEWIKSDMDKINQAITLLSSVDPTRGKEGMDMVANVLPFLLIGGFSKTEVVAYLKAKLEAAKQVLSDSQKKQLEEESMVDRGEAHTTASKTMENAAEISDSEPSIPFKTGEAGQDKVDELRRSGSERT